MPLKLRISSVYTDTSSVGARRAGRPIPFFALPVRVGTKIDPSYPLRNKKLGCYDTYSFNAVFTMQFGGAKAASTGGPEEECGQ